MTLVALTGYGLPEDRRRALESGFDAHLTKPVTLSAILELLARDHRQSKAPLRRAGRVTTRTRGPGKSAGETG